jgi:hypothetical protein
MEVLGFKDQKIVVTYGRKMRIIFSRSHHHEDTDERRKEEECQSREECQEESKGTSIIDLNHLLKEQLAGISGHMDPDLLDEINDDSKSFFFETSFHFFEI